MQAGGKSLRSNSKKGFVGLVAAFFLIQITIDCIHSVTAFPFVHYGMFSESLSRPDSLLCYEVEVNGRILQPADFRIYQWDMIQQPLGAFDRQTATGDFAFDKSKFRRSMPAVYSATSANLGNSQSLVARFPEWYRGYLSRVIGQPIRSLVVNRCRYRYTDARFVLLNKTPWISR